MRVGGKRKEGEKEVGPKWEGNGNKTRHEEIVIESRAQL